MILASGKTGAQRYDDNSVNKPVPDLDLILIAQTNQRAFEETQGWSYSNNKGSTDSQATDLSIIEEGDVNDYNPSLAQLIQTYVANNSYLEVNGSSTANNIILEPRKIADVNSPNGVNYSKTTSLPFAFRDNLRFCFRATATNTGAVQFSITGLSGLSGAIDSVDENGNALSGGEIVGGKFYEIVLTGTATTKKVILKSREQDIYKLTGSVVSFATSTPPLGWLECNGSAISRTSYSELFAIIGTTWGSGDGSTTFNIPDLRGEFIRGWDNGAGNDSGRSFASSQSWAIENITGSQNGLAWRTGYTGTGGLGAFQAYGSGGQGANTLDGANAAYIDFDASRVVQTSTETRPRNISLMYCIKY